jgi:hypothetical protein
MLSLDLTGSQFWTFRWLAPALALPAAHHMPVLQPGIIRWRESAD